MVFQPTWLYIKQHNQTGLNYFGKTITAVDSLIEYATSFSEIKSVIRLARLAQLPPMLGKKHTDETKAKISQNKERAQKISQARKGIKFSAETRKKMSISAKRRCAERKVS